MGSETPLRFPVIDFSKLDLNPGTPEWESVKSQVRKALEEYGCFEILFDKIPTELRRAIFGAMEEFFDLPSQTKVRNVSGKPYNRYLGQFPGLPLYESMGIEDADISQKVESLSRIFWPEGNPSFSKTIQSFSEQVSELDKIMRRMVIESLGLEKYLDEHMNSTRYLLRVMKYKGPQTTEKKLGLVPHTDTNMVTILYQNQVEGLEVQTKDGEWINVKPSPNSFIAMIGDSFLAWTNGRVHCANHRVMMTGNESRCSAGLFSFPKTGYVIKAPEELIDEEHPLLFKPFDYDEYMAFVHTEAGQRAASALKTYCGV